MGRAALRISALPDVAAAASRKRLAFARIEGNDLVIDSGLPPEAPLNDHLVALWGHLKHERRYLKSLQGDGAEFRINVPATSLFLIRKTNITDRQSKATRSMSPPPPPLLGAAVSVTTA